MCQEDEKVKSSETMRISRNITQPSLHMQADAPEKWNGGSLQAALWCLIIRFQPCNILQMFVKEVRVVNEQRALNYTINTINYTITPFFHDSGWEKVGTEPKMMSTAVDTRVECPVNQGQSSEMVLE